MARFALLLQVAALATGIAADAGQSPAAEDIDHANNESLLWGPYKPNLYFGVRPRSPNGLWTGLMWSRADSYSDPQHGFRYTCEQRDDIHGYGWDEYDARTGGVQTIHDEKNLIDITTSFVKIPGGEHGGSWAARIKGTLRDGAPADLKTMLFYFIAQEGVGEVAPEGKGGKFGFDDDVTFKGNSKSLGDFTLVVTKGEGKHPTSQHHISETRKGDKTLVHSSAYSEDVMWQGQPIVFSQLQESVSYIQKNYAADGLPPAWQVYRVEHRPGEGNVHVVEKTFQGPFEFDVIFSSASAGKAMTSDDVTEQLKLSSKSFSDRFSRIFDFKAPFTAAKYHAFGKSMFSNLLGGVGYFHGHQLIDRSYATEYDEDSERFWEEAAEARSRGAQKLEGPYELYTSVPSRPFFPRGFLWDEGFHLVPIADWDINVALDIVRSWYKTMDDDGWIPREQILGPEARSRVPEEFQVQYPHYANPPTLFLIIEGFMKRLRESKADGGDGQAGGNLYTAYLDNPEVGEKYVKEMYPLLRRQYDWFRKTQRGDIKSYDREAYSTKEAYRWKGRTETHVLPSGLDDYPRPQPPHPGELHVDLMSWVGLMAKSLINIADALGMKEDVAELERNLNAIERNLDDLHWSEKEGCYCDATVDDFEEHQLVCHKGYVSLSPFFLGLIKHDSPKMGRILDLIGDEDHIFSPHGIRSLSKQDPLYETGENYWRSPVWMPMNYLILTELHNVASHKGPFQEKARDLYSRLRKNLVDTVYKSWEETGFAWEQYHPETGAGQRTQHFTGWTSLVVKIMAMEDLSESRGKDEL
ncbi:family 63 glycoside hydrolase [Stachybotrys elegans]|uniref:Mannosyl-oligosaccharide glucosidase n=1 Tax=Stachybotrys elegans TaxID=80388 RepID=A0A8K0SLX5_9HYPO|nr:family 63 glycoside hydrolase [Stachybotrys elegans]